MTDQSSDATGPAPRVIDQRYEVVRRLGKGGFGEVHLVRDRLHNGELLAIKTLRPVGGIAEGFEERFLREIRILRELSHEGIPRIYNDGRTADGDYFFTMEFVDGVTLSSVLRRKPGVPLESARIVRIVRRVLEILDYAHQRGVVHRDLKPGNIMLVREGQADEDVRVLDFGIAKALRGANANLDMPTLTAATGIGTPHYMAPEQLRGTQIDQRADLYSLGVMLYQMCSGRLPFEGDTDLQIATARLVEDPKPLDPDVTPPQLRKLVFDLLARDPAQRPRTREVLGVLLEAHGARGAAERIGNEATIPNGIALGDVRRSDARRTRPWLVALIVLLALSGASAWAWKAGWFGAREQPHARLEPAPAPNDGAASGANAAPHADPTPNEPPSNMSSSSEPPSSEPPASTSGSSSAARDADGDGVPDAADLCPQDPLKSAPGACGCGVPDHDRDGDGTADCKDGCPDDPAKTDEGVCGCGTPDTDSDSDGTPDCHDRFPSDPKRTRADECDCGRHHGDSDGDGTFDCADGCPQNALKTAPGACGCERSDVDTDGDGTADCVDLCPLDPQKLAPGACGCGVSEADSDGDGVADCNDGCPLDRNKTTPGMCGCGVSDVDSDGDRTADCVDGCPDDRSKTAPGVCGCGVPDVDLDGNGAIDCTEVKKPAKVEPTQPPQRLTEPERPALSWAEVLAQAPDPAVVTDEDLRRRIGATGLPWRVRDRRTGIELLLVPPGRYTRGADRKSDPEADKYEQPPHPVELTKPFYLGRYEVTEAQWSAVGAGNAASADLGLPQADVTFIKAGEWLARSGGLRLPTEAQWEYAARAGTTTPRYGELDQVAWYKKNSGGAKHEVGTKRANPLGFHDMLGNVREWCGDSYVAYPRTPDLLVDPAGPPDGKGYALRGACWLSDGGNCRASFRNRWSPKDGGPGDGLRVARDP
ncbi:MAG: SUMF1/EgtB/PvdO family nonheme iron enzyme [Planctomycetes bacterium]|nr:SUMF1/EgtB/PvdO family nonheme iron enzyme [Planctomycetota bacterium]